MKDYKRLWAEELSQRHDLAPSGKITVVGTRNQHLGPRIEFAEVQLTIEPAPTFEVIYASDFDEELYRLNYLDWAIFGLLDVLMVSKSSPLTRARISLERATFHPVDSSQMAFRHAGRDAGRKIVEALK